MLLECSGYATPMPETGLSLQDGGPGPAVPGCLWYWLSDKAQSNLHRTALVALHQPSGHLSNLFSAQQSTQSDHLEWTHAELIAAAENLAAHLDRNGVSKGDRVATFIDNSAEWVVLLWATIRIGAVFAPQDPTVLNRRDELQAVIESLRPKAVMVKDTMEAAKFKSQSKSWRCPIQLVCQGKKEQLLENWKIMSELDVPPNPHLPVLESEPEDPVVTVYSSGSTNEPKGCPHTLRTVFSAIEGYRSFYDSQWATLESNSEPTFVLSTRSFALNSFGGCVNTFSAGGCVVIPDSDFNPEATLRAIHQTKATHLIVVPSQLRALMSSPDIDDYRPSTLRFINISGDTVSSDLVEKARIELGPKRIILSWSMTEGGPVFGWQNKERVQLYNNIPMVGRVLPGSQVKICVSGTDELANFGEIGDLHISSDSIIEGYLGGVYGDAFYQDDSRTWFMTGDLAVMEEDGAVAVVGRSKDIIKCSGWPLLPSIIEDYIKEFFGIESQAIGVPNPSGGEKPVAVIKVRRASADLKQELKQGLPRHSGAEYTLGAVYLLSELGLKDWPLGQTRKISKADLRSAVLERFPVKSANALPLSMYDLGYLEELDFRL